jgi:hypothetical protein
MCPIMFALMNGAYEQQACVLSIARKIYDDRIRRVPILLNLVGAADCSSLLPLQTARSIKDDIEGGNLLACRLRAHSANSRTNA